MKYLLALRQPRLSALWFSQVLSALGDQLYMVAAMWIAVEHYESKAALVAASISIPRMLFGLFGGAAADIFDRRAILIVTDLVRFVALASLPIIFATQGQIQFWHLIVAGAIIGGFGSFFDPALQSSLPSLSGSRPTLEAMTGLMELTTRLARVFGSGLTGFLVMFIPIHHFFTIDAVTFIISAATVFSVGAHLDWGNVERKHVEESHRISHFFKDIGDGLKHVTSTAPLAYTFCQIWVICVLWGVSFTVGVPMLVKKTFAENIGNYGAIVGMYGVGSAIANVLFANLHVRSSWRAILGSDVILGTGFLLIAFSHSLPLALAGSAIAATGGAMGDLLFLNHLMATTPKQLLGKILSLRFMIFSGGSAFGLLIASPLFCAFGPAAVVAVAATLMVLCGIIGMSLFWRTPAETVVTADVPPDASDSVQVKPIADVLAPFCAGPD